MYQWEHGPKYRQSKLLMDGVQRVGLEDVWQ
jgi:hypothetical protein